MQINTKIVGILNLSPDSFFNGDIYSSEQLIKKVNEFVRYGVCIVDAGAESTSLLSRPITLGEELLRLQQFFKIIPHFPKVIFSLDTMKSQVAKIGVEKGVKVINDVTGGRFDEEIFKVVAENKEVRYILMYCKNNLGLADIKLNSDSSPILEKIMEFFDERLEKMKTYGICEDQIILDPGMGALISSDYKDSVEVLKNLHILKSRYKYEILVGTSKKGFLSKLAFDDGPDDRIGSSLATSIFACQKGIDYIRVHDVKEIHQFINCFNNLLE